MLSDDGSVSVSCVEEIRLQYVEKTDAAPPATAFRAVTPHNIASEMSSILSERRSVYVET